MDKTKVIVVAGPTASGKTTLAVEIAKAVGGEVISADSMQVYKGMEIASAAPTEQEMAGIEHHMVQFLERDVPFQPPISAILPAVLSAISYREAKFPS